MTNYSIGAPDSGREAGARHPGPPGPVPVAAGSKPTRTVLDAETMTRPEVAEALAHRSLAILPIGATEQHGPHLPLGTDTLLAQEVARRLGEVTGALVFPPIPLGYSWVWHRIPGTLTVDEATVQQVIKEIAHNLHRQGLRTLVLLNGHGANESALKYAVRELADEIPMKILHFSYFNHFGDAAAVVESPKWRGTFHACEVETSLLLAVRPDLCHMDRAVREYPDAPPTYGVSPVAMGDVSRSGVFGDPTLATAEKGRALLDAAVVNLAEIIRYAEENEQR